MVIVLVGFNLRLLLKVTGEVTKRVWLMNLDRFGYMITKRSRKLKSYIIEKKFWYTKKVSLNSLYSKKISLMPVKQFFYSRYYN